MKKELMKSVCLILFVFMFVSFASAEIFLSQPSSVYNLGDDFKLDIGVIETGSITGFLEVSTVCGNSTESQIYRNPLSVKAGERKDVSISTVMEKYIVGDSLGECFFRVTYGSEQKDSQTFYVSDEIVINVANIGFSFNPGATVEVKGSAVKKNGKNVEGYIESKIEELGVNYNSQISDGKFSFNLTLPDNAKAGVYSLKVYSYDKDESGNVRNSGESSYTLKVNQVPKKVELAFNSQNITPGDSLVYTVNVYDQANDLVKTEVTSSIYNPKSELVKKTIIDSGEYVSFNTSSNFIPSYWTVEAKLNELVERRNFLIEEYAKVRYFTNNNTLTVVNIGNVPYKKTVEFRIGNESVFKDLDLEIGASETYKIVGPKGEYDLQVVNGDNLEMVGPMSFRDSSRAGISGFAISDSNQGASASIKNGLWIVILLALIVAGIYYYLKVRKKKYYGNQSSSKSIIPSRSIKGLPMTEGGNKEEAVVIALKIKNHMAVMNSTSNAPDSIQSALSSSGAEKYTLSNTNEFKVIVLSPSITGSKDNALNAIKMGRKIEEALLDHNKKYSQKIMFGIGVNMGSLIIERKQDGSFNFVSSGNTVPVAKRIAENASNELLLSEDVHKRTLGSVKADKTKDNYWKIRRIVDRDGSNIGFINSFKQRQGIDDKNKRMTDNL